MFDLFLLVALILVSSNTSSITLDVCWIGGGLVIVVVFVTIYFYYVMLFLGRFR